MNERSRKINLTLVIRTVDYGGAESHILKMVRNIDRSKFNVYVICLVRDAEHHQKEAFIKAGVNPIIPPYYKNDPRLLFWLAKIWKEHRIDVVHSFLWRSDVICSLVAFLTGYRNLIASERGSRGDKHYNKVKGLIDRYLTFKASKLVCPNSNFAASVVLKNHCPSNKIRVIHNGIEFDGLELEKNFFSLRESYGIDETCKIIGIVARLDSVKSHNDFIKAAKYVKSSYKGKIRFLVIGDGTLRNKLENMVMDLGLSEDFIFTGFTEKPIAFIQDFDVGVLSSHRESFPNVILEYMACGKPVVATNVGGVPELVIDRVTGILVPPGQPEEMAHAIVALLKDPKMAEKMGALGKERVQENFSMPVVTRKYERLYESVNP